MNTKHTMTQVGAADPERHTYAPWHAYEIPTASRELTVHWRIGNARHCVAGIALTGDSRVDHANAAHIVRCVNAHDDLVAALRDLVDQTTVYINSDSAELPDVTTARAALAKVQE